jgi:uncharacterized protein (DUF608 family)
MLQSAAPVGRVFSGDALREVAFPLGGIGTGTISLGGRGNLRDWEIFNRPAKGNNLPFTFFALWLKPEGEAPVARVLERQLLPPFVDGAGLSPGTMAGLPRFANATFTGAYPFAHLDLADPNVPVELSLEAFNPFVPLDADASSFPVAVFRWTIRNPGPKPVDCTIALSVLNPVGHDGTLSDLRGRRSPLFGRNLNEWVDEGAARGLRMSGAKVAGDAPGAGSLALLTDWSDVTYSVHWERGGWFDDLQNFWDDFRDDGRLPSDPATDPTPDGESDVGTLGLRARLAPGESAALPFVLAWHFPNLTNYWNSEPAVRGKRLGNYYTARFSDAWDAGRACLDDLPALEARSRAYVEELWASTLPPAVLDAVSSQASIIRTTTCLQTEDGRFHGFEGCNDNAGCCPMNCTHVWNYEQTVAYLFPALERTMRYTDFGVNTLPSGEQKFRTLLPIASGTLWNFVPAADGQMGGVVKLYREWQLSGDDAFLRELWPSARRSLAYAWQHWDPDRDGVMEGEQHNTYDVEFYGPNTMTGLLYLAALRAAEEIARYLGETDSANEYKRVYESGRARIERDLWNGSYFIQLTRMPTENERLTLTHPAILPGGIRPGEPEPRYQYGPGCLSDQLLGQWLATVVGLGHLVDPGHVRSALSAIVAHNFRRSLATHESCQRTYALNDEAGLILCSWPNGGRPRYPFPYADEVWTGIEYQVAAHLMYEGMIDDGLAIVDAIRARHDGSRRNPWDEFECGHHYARAMASWSTLLALSGFQHRAPTGEIAFAPRINAGDFRCFFSTGRAWGSFSQSIGEGRLTATITVREGELKLRKVELARLNGTSATRTTARVGDQNISAQVEHVEEVAQIAFASEVTVPSGTTLKIHFE